MEKETNSVMNKKLRHDATASLKGFIYQFYKAVDTCFDLERDEKVIFEKYGDITVSDNVQIEVKQTKDNLTNLDSNFWNTLKNWLQDSFEVGRYKHLILFTTQEIGENSVLKGWNDKKFEEKTFILNEILQDYLKSEKEKSKKTLNLLGYVLADNRKDKLAEIIKKFIILCSSKEGTDYYESIKDRRAKGIIDINKDLFIQSLLGYIISPENTEKGQWEITYEDFQARVNSITEQLCSGTMIFPKKYSSHKITEKEKKTIEKHLFVKKIEDIEYKKVINKAISDYIRTNKTIHEEMRKYISKEQELYYEQEVIDAFEPLYMNASIDAKEDNLIKLSQKFYNEVTSSPPPQYRNFNDTPRYFRNGFLHNLADDEQKDIKWELEVEDNE